MSKRSAAPETETGPSRQYRRRLEPHLQAPIQSCAASTTGTKTPGLAPGIDRRTDPHGPMTGTQDWEAPWLWAALGGPPDTDNVDSVWIVSHMHCPMMAIVQALQQGASYPDAVPNLLPSADLHLAAPDPSLQWLSTVAQWSTLMPPDTDADQG